MKLTDKTITSLKAKADRYEVPDDAEPGLSLRITPAGAKSWYLRYRLTGSRADKVRRLKLGDYSDEFGLAKARKAARHAKRKIDTGIDPAAERDAARLALSAADTIGDLAEDYLTRHAKKHKRSWKDDQRILNVEVLPQWRTRKVREITRRDVRELVEAIAERGSPIMANRVLALIRRVLNHGISRDWIDANVASRIEKPGAEVARDRVLTDDEIRKLWRCLTNLPATPQLPAPFRKRETGPKDDPLCPISPRQAAILQVRLLTAQRGGEVARMRWQDVDLDAGWWTIPAEHAKNGQAHRVPLVGKALDLVKAQQPKQAQGMTSHTLPGRATGPADKNARVFVFTDGETGAQDRAKKAPGIVADTIGVAFRGHDLRRTAATKMAEAGIPRVDVGRVLNHAEGARATRVYDRYDGDREKRLALETWDRALTAILDPRTSATVTPITARRGAQHGR